jgi:hypothetical protein
MTLLSELRKQAKDLYKLHKPHKMARPDLEKFISAHSPEQAVQPLVEKVESVAKEVKEVKKVVSDDEKKEKARAKMAMVRAHRKKKEPSVPTETMPEKAVVKAEKVEKKKTVIGNEPDSVPLTKAKMPSSLQMELLKRK